MKDEDFTSILGNWGVFPFEWGVELSHKCDPSTDASYGTDSSGKCICGERVPEEVAQAALFIPGFKSGQYLILYHEEANL